MTLSGVLIQHVRSLFDQGVRELGRGGVHVRADGKNGDTFLALPSYVIAVAAVEALINETFFSGMARLQLEGASLFELDDKWFENIDVRSKTVIIAHLLWGKTLRQGEQPSQDFATLVRGRNAIVHYRMDDKEPSFACDLDQRKTGLDGRPPDILTSPVSWLSGVGA